MDVAKIIKQIGGGKNQRDWRLDTARSVCPYALNGEVPRLSWAAY